MKQIILMLIGLLIDAILLRKMIKKNDEKGIQMGILIMGIGVTLLISKILS